MDMFVLAGDFLSVLERAALEPLPCLSLSSKDDKCSQSRAKVGICCTINLLFCFCKRDYVFSHG